MKIVISGGGEIGLQFAQDLAADHDLFVIESDPGLCERLGELDVQVVRGNPTNLKSLLEAQVDTADHFLACAHSDEVNIISCLAVKQLGKAHTRCFVNKAHYFDTFSGELGEQLVIDGLIWPERILAEDISRIIAVPGAIDVKVFEHESLKLLEFRLKAGDPLAGKQLRELDLPKGVLVVAVFRGDDVMIPGGLTTLLEDDKVILIGLEAGMRKIERRFGINAGGALHVTVVGGGNIGLLLAEILEKLGNVRLRVVEGSHERCQELVQRLAESTTVLNADGTDRELLESLQLTNCDCLVAVTGRDETNLLVSLLAKKLGARKVITRVHKASNLDFFEEQGVDVALSARFNAVRSVVRQIESEGVDLFTLIEKGKAEIEEIEVPADFEPRRVMDMKLPEGVIIAAIRRSAHTIVPHGIDKVKPKDRLRVFCAGDRKEALVNYFASITGNGRG